MFVRELSVSGYRNLDTHTLLFDDSVILFLGENAQGKTNILETLYVLGFAKSHRTSKDRELIAWGEEYARIHGTVEKRVGPLTLDVQFSGQGKRAKINHLEQRRLSEYIGALNVVMFAPEDLNLVKGGPKQRRRFIDMEIGQISNVYLHDLSQYHKTLKQRNQLLKDFWRSKSPDHVMLDVLTEQLAAVAAKVVHRRLAFIRQLESWAKEIHEQISRSLEQLQLQYEASADVDGDLSLTQLQEAYTSQYVQKKDQEIRRGLSLVGPHREDVLIYVNDRDVGTYGSQGQQRTAALSLKLAEIELITEATGDPPILLLDDVLSELDDHRQSHLLHAIQGKVQTFVTTTNVSGIEHRTLQQAKRYNVQNGRISLLD
ncbi:DNA replication/repair protein RecF [Geomicrobium sp. JCM 19039]|uniref:DNA replication/repair protein RecF n=1 Tax=Geomicrobium sp. JCM 19039 TaxID=1460636 RepID=UPI00045F121B|nr:DNA replication/repair protein RecF [Geomicrobium sp. JCM 19039]GAK11982.1 DNA recombination and repair protein RecF [Geomicrobium sp. JCM 19039]